MPYFVDFLEETVNQKKSLICVGLDPHPDQMQVDDLYEFCESIVTEVSPYVSAIKPNLAFFEAFGIEGLKTLEKVVKFVREIRNSELSIGKKIKIISKSEVANSKVIRKSIVAIKDINKGEVFSIKNISCKRPNLGIPANHWDKVIGKRSKFNFKKDDFIKLR